MQLYILIVPFTLGIAISVIDKFQHIIEEAKIVAGNPVLISNKPSGSAELAKSLDTNIEIALNTRNTK